MDQNRHLGISQLPFFSFIPFYFSVLATWLAHNLFIGWPALKYKFISMMNSIWGAQHSIMVCFSFTAGFTWCTTASQVDSSALFLVAWLAHNLLIASPASQHRFLFWFLQTITFPPFRTCLSFIMSGHVSFLMFHSFAIFLSQCASAGSAEGSASTFLFTWPGHNLLIAWPVSHYRHGFYRQLHFYIYCIAFIYVSV